MCCHAKQLIRAVDEAVQIAFALGNVQGQYILLHESMFTEHLTPNMSGAMMDNFHQINHHLSRQLTQFLQSNPILEFNVEQRAHSGQYSISGPSLRLQYQDHPCLGKQSFDSSHVLLCTFKYGGHAM